MDPIRGDLDKDGLLYFADGNSDPHRYGPDGAHKGVEGQGRGAVWRFDIEARTLSLVIADPTFVNPVCVKVVPDWVGEW